MMGEHGGNQDRLFYSFNLDEHVPADHLLRGIDRFLDLAETCYRLKPCVTHPIPRAHARPEPRQRSNAKGH